MAWKKLTMCTRRQLVNNWPDQIHTFKSFSFFVNAEQPKTVSSNYWVGFGPCLSQVHVLGTLFLIINLWQVHSSKTGTLWNKCYLALTRRVGCNGQVKTGMLMVSNYLHILPISHHIRVLISTINSPWLTQLSISISYVHINHDLWNPQLTMLHCLSWIWMTHNNYKIFQ